MNLDRLSPELIQQCGVASADLERDIDQARIAAVQVIRGIEARLVGALAGTHLRGLPNLVSTALAIRFYGARVRAHADVLLADEALVLSSSGDLQMAWCRDRLLGTRPVRDDELRAEDLEAYVRTLLEVLPLHVRKAAKAGEKFTRIERLASRLGAALQEADNEAPRGPERG
jgi:hypothetical protein